MYNSVLHHGHLVCFVNDNNCGERTGQGQNSPWAGRDSRPGRGVLLPSGGCWSEGPGLLTEGTAFFVLFLPLDDDDDFT